jgi:hypothetical protein
LQEAQENNGLQIDGALLPKVVPDESVGLAGAGQIEDQIMQLDQT